MTAAALAPEAPARCRVEIRLLGEFSVTVDGTPIRRWQAGKARSLFQYLVLERGRLVPRATLTDALWPDADVGPESSSLRVAVHALRRTLNGAAGDDAPDLSHASNGYRLDPDRIWVDVHEFERAIADASAARREERFGLATLHYREALSLYSGDLLPEEGTPWVDLRRHGLRSSVLIALESQLDTAVKADDGPEVVELARRVLEIEPHRERAYRALILQHGRMGQAQQADRWFELCEQRMAEELDEQPDLRTRHIRDRAVSGQYQRPSLTPDPV